MRIAITMCHGVYDQVTHAGRVFDRAHFDRLMRVAAELGFQSLSYDDLAAWRAGTRDLPPRPLMIDFDHPVRSVCFACREVLDEYGFRGNLFVNTGWLDGVCPPFSSLEGLVATWDELALLLDAGWHFGAHTVTHPDLSQLSREDPTGERLRAELDDCNASLRRHLGLDPQDFAFTGTSWSSRAEAEVKQRYRFGRLWIVGAEYQADGRTLRYADLVGAPGPDEADGGPPYACRYITRDTGPYRLPSMELEKLLYAPDDFRRYLEMALS